MVVAFAWAGRTMAQTVVLSQGGEVPRGLAFASDLKAVEPSEPLDTSATRLAIVIDVPDDTGNLEAFVKAGGRLLVLGDAVRQLPASLTGAELGPAGEKQRDRLSGGGYGKGEPIVLRAMDRTHAISRDLRGRLVVSGPLSPVLSYEAERNQTLVSVDSMATAHKQPTHTPVLWLSPLEAGVVACLSLQTWDAAEARPMVEATIKGLRLDEVKVEANPKVHARESSLAKQQLGEQIIPKRENDQSDG